MNIDTQLQSFVQHLDCEAKCRSERFHAPPTHVPYILVILNWQIVSTAGWLDALCSYIASKRDAMFCTLAISCLDDDHLAMFHKGLQQIAVALGNIPCLEHLNLIHCWHEYKFTDKFSHCNCATECEGLHCDFVDGRNLFKKVEYRSEAIVLQHVRQIKIFCGLPGPGCTKDVPIASSNAKELAEALQKHPLLKVVGFYTGLPQKTIPEALLLMPKLSIVVTNIESLTTWTIREIVVKESMRELALVSLHDEDTTSVWTALCSALSSKSAKPTLLKLCISKFPCIVKFHAELSRALLTNESLETLELIFPRALCKKCSCILSLPHGAFLAQALATHPWLHGLRLDVSYDGNDPPPTDHHFWQELFCNGIAQMKSLRQLTLKGVPLWTASMVQALRQLVPALFELTIEWINTTKEWIDVAGCVVYGRRLTTLNIELSIYVQHEEGKQEYTKLMEGVLAMN